MTKSLPPHLHDLEMRSWLYFLAAAMMRAISSGLGLLGVVLIDRGTGSSLHT
eukprot:CAMPEP_0180646070 /NCGR_PEP_ID=MMETSP1037_2-20121125/49383_1 /TAXON_ID=632150 /ORGANISM="Azadinium spinosum, Strain 3D9" /LENGTH=51 /DNA_ID=CAMNT_0022670083 /DNA_START=114 /DNA_END=265 /DNA_ORIENTATION=+